MPEAAWMQCTRRMTPHGHVLSDMSSADFLNSARVPDNAIVKIRLALPVRMLWLTHSDKASDEDD